MTTTEENLRAFILADANIKASVATRVSYNKVPQDKDVPYIFFQQQGADDSPVLDDSPRAPLQPRYAIECWAATPASAVALKNLVQPRLNLYRGTFGDTTVKGIFAADADDEYVPLGDGGDSGLHGVAIVAEVVL